MRAVSTAFQRMSFSLNEPYCFFTEWRNQDGTFQIDGNWQIVTDILLLKAQGSSLFAQKITAVANVRTNRNWMEKVITPRIYSKVFGFWQLQLKVLGRNFLLSFIKIHFCFQKGLCPNFSFCQKIVSLQLRWGGCSLRILAHTPISMTDVTEWLLNITEIDHQMIPLFFESRVSE